MKPGQAQTGVAKHTGSAGTGHAEMLRRSVAPTSMHGAPASLTRVLQGMSMELHHQSDQPAMLKPYLH